MQLKHTLFAAGCAVALHQAAFAARITVGSDITSNTTWSKNNTYVLDKSIFVKNGATLTIQPGTTIIGAYNATNDTYGSLIITREGKIQAVGTKAEPIVMTVDNESSLDPAAGDGGLWGGLILLGKAPINFFTGPTTNAGENEIEGFPAGSTEDIKYGGSQPNHSSGRVKYVSIRFGGYVYAPNKEINGFTLGGVGSGTEIEFVEILSNTDDGMEVFGGTVRTKRVAVAFCQDDGFDMDEGHQGFHQFWFTIQNANGGLGDRGGEWDGGNGSIKDGAPFNNTRVYNATFFGDGTGTGGGNAGFYLDDNFAGQLHNSVVHDFSGNAVDASGDGIGTPAPVFMNTSFGAFGGNYGQLDTISGGGVTKVGSNPGIRRLNNFSRTPNQQLDPRAVSGGALYNLALSAFPGDAPAGFFEDVDYRGAFGDQNWLEGWSYLSKKGYLTPTSGPVFDKQPKSAVVPFGKKVVLKVKATSDSDVSYQWYKNGKKLKGKTSKQLKIAKFKASKAGKYWCVATSEGKTAKSAKAVLEGPEITKGLTTAKIRTGFRTRISLKTNFKANQFKVKNLPPGLKINKRGLISGTPTKPGSYKTVITAIQKKGKKVKYKAQGKKTFKVS